MQKQILLALVIKAMNDTLGPEAIIPSALVFRDIPSLRSITGPVIPRPTLAERAEIALEARRHFAKHVALSKVKRALHNKAPMATNRVHQTGDKVLLWREVQVENRIGDWLGPYTVVSFDPNSKIILVQMSADARYERYNIVQVKPFLKQTEASTDFIETLYSLIRQFALPNTDLSVNMTEVVQKNDKRAYSWEMKEAIKSEAQDLIRRGSFRVIPRKEIPDGANALTARFVLAIKSTADGDIKYKARNVVGGHRDIMKFKVHGAQTLQE